VKEQKIINHEANRVAIMKYLRSVDERRVDKKTSRTNAPIKVTAFEIAEACGIGEDCDRESRRRKIRRYIRRLRDDGESICADGDGLWLARTEKDYQRQERFERRNGLARMKNVGKIKHSESRERLHGQERLF